MVISNRLQDFPTSLQRLGLALLLGVAPLAQAARVQVALADWDPFELDVDGDGETEIRGSLSNEQNIAVSIHFDFSIAVHNFPGTLPGQGGGGSANNFATLDALRADPIFSGDISLVTPLFGDFHLGTNTAVLNANKAKPIWAGWRFGTAGTGNEPFQVFGFIIDASAFFQTEGQAPIDVYTHLYGSLSFGDTLSNVSLASTLGDGGAPTPVPPTPTPNQPEPAPPTEHPEFLIDAEFTSVHSGSLSFLSQVGFTYHLRQATALPESTIEATLEGNGERLTFTFDDTKDPKQQAIFWVEVQSQNLGTNN